MPIHSCNTDFLKRYMNKYFIETGSFKGDTIQLALDAGFEEIRSIELNGNNFNFCRERFIPNPNVYMWYGASEEKFWYMIEDIKEPITFWLDSHYSGVGATYETSLGVSYSSLVSELITIARHPIKTHTILIDDRRDFGTINMDYVQESIIRQLVQAINPAYKIKYETGDPSNPLFKDDILVAYL